MTAHGLPSGLPPLPAFTVTRLPRIEFGSGRVSQVPHAVARYGRHALIVTGRSSFRTTSDWPRLLAALDDRAIAHEDLAISGEPSPDTVQEFVDEHRASGIDVVLGIGGGSVLDAAKAIAGLLRVETTVFDHLEGVGPELPYRGPAVPFVAVPTTAGTGSEATKNAVLSRQGEGGFKKSFRDEQLVAREAIVDPDLLTGCPPELIAADGLDALTQLLESYVSARAMPFTDALALAGLAAVRDGLLPWYEAVDAARVDAARVDAARGDAARSGLSRADAADAAPPSDDATLPARTRMAYGALLSGICLAQAGLGAAHGLASPLGAFFPIPHGVACGAVLAAATRANIRALEEREPESRALARYAEIGRLLCEAPDAPDDVGRADLITLLDDWTGRVRIGGLARYGVTAADIARIVDGGRGGSMKANPIVLSDREVAGILEASLDG